MRIANYSNGMTISVSATELVTIGHPMVDIDVDWTGKREARSWVKLTGKSDGEYRVGKPNQSGYSAVRVQSKQTEVLGLFGSEGVPSWTPGAAVLFGHKPGMRTDVIKRTYSGRASAKARPNPPAMPQDVTFQYMHDAVKLINNFADKHKDLELAVVDGQLQVRMYIEFGK